MQRVSVLLACSLLSAVLVSQAGAQSQPPARHPKPAETVTALSPAQSQTLSAAQRAKLAELSAPAPRAIAPPPAAGVKFPSASTSEPIAPGAHAQPMTRHWSPRLERSGATAPKAVDRQTTLPPDPKLEADRAAVIARKPLTGNRPGAAGTTPKLAPFETRGPASSAPSLAQQAKRAQADSLAARRPR